MRTLSLALALLVFLTPSHVEAQGTQGAFKESHRRLLGCFGEAFTLVEDVWRIGPQHVMQLADAARDATTPAKKQVVAGMVASAVEVDQEAAFTVARNLEGCITEALAGLQPDATTAVLATAVRTEVDSSVEDADDYIKQYDAARAVIQGAIDRTASDPHEDQFAAYDGFGTRIRARLGDIRKKLDVLVMAATP